MDNNLVITVKAVGIPEAQAKMTALGASIQKMTVNANGTVSASGKLSSTLSQQASSTDKVAQSTNRASKSQENYFVHIAKTTVQSALVNKAFLGLVGAAGDAVKQVDLMTNFPAAMGALGLSTEDAGKSLIKLRDYAAQTGISLTEATTSVARFAEITQNVKAATAEFVGVKNAVIAGGAGAEVQKNAIEQLIQSYSRGKPQLIEWRSMMVAMPAQLSQIAKAMGFVNAQQLGESLTAGKTSMQAFMTQLTTMSTGTGPIANQALARMQGIEYASRVMQQTLTNGLAAIYQAVGRQNIISFFTFLTQVIGVLASGIVTLINDMISLFNIISGVFGGPQIANFSGEAKGAADAIGGGADNAGDMADGLGDAADKAKEINKSLASFDKMNVLADKTSGKAKDTGAGGAGGLSSTDASALEGVFDKLGGKLAEASKWAKIFAGILAGILGIKFAQGILDQLNGTIKTIKETSDNLGKLKDAFKGVEKEGDKASKSLGEKIAGGLGKSAGKMSTAISGFVGGIAGAISTKLGPAMAGVATGIVTAIGDVLVAGAGALGVSVGVFVVIIAAAVIAIIAIIWLIWTNWDTIWGWIKTAFNAVVGFIVAVWQTLYDIFAGPVKFIWQFISAIFILIVAIIAMALEIIFKLVVGTIVLIYNVLAAIAGWINTNVIQPIWQFFQWLWNTITGAVVAAWQFIFNNILKPIATWIFNNVITPIVNFFKSMWNTISGFISGIFNSFVNILSPLGSWLYNNIILPIGRFFSGLWDGIKTGLSNMLDGLKTIIGALGGIIKAPINGVIILINAVLKGLNKIKVPDWVPGLGGKGVNFPMIPTLAKGGVVTQSSLVNVGENGVEAIVPLENNLEWIDKLAAKINSASGGGGQPVQLIVQIGEDKIVTKVIDLINEKTQMSGRNTIYV